MPHSKSAVRVMAEGKRRIAVTGGGTAGHILPALDVLETYRKMFGAEGLFIGCEAGMARSLVEIRGVGLAIIPGLPWALQNWLGKVRAAACLPGAIRSARSILRSEKTELVIGAGGYGSFSTCIAARSLGLPVVILEGNAAPGISNRMLAGIAALVCAGSDETARHFSRATLVTGLPCGAVPSQAQPGPPWRFLVLGGSEGSPLLDREAPRLFAELQRRGVPFTVRHMSGFGAHEGVERAYSDVGVTARVDGFVDDIAAAYAGASIALASGGARTLAELAAAAIPSLIAPLPGAAWNHQEANARLYAATSGAYVIPQGQWDDAALADRIQSMICDPAEWQRLSGRAAALARPEAARRIVEACENLLIAARNRTLADPVPFPG